MRLVYKAALTTDTALWAAAAAAISALATLGASYNAFRVRKVQQQDNFTKNLLSFIGSLQAQITLLNAESAQKDKLIEQLQARTKQLEADSKRHDREQKERGNHAIH